MRNHTHTTLLVNACPTLGLAVCIHFASEMDSPSLSRLPLKGMESNKDSLNARTSAPFFEGAGSFERGRGGGERRDGYFLCYLTCLLG